jgi:hypothetical protein
MRVETMFENKLHQKAFFFSTRLKKNTRDTRGQGRVGLGAQKNGIVEQERLHG